jgi:hypothetical protein
MALGIADDLQDNLTLLRQTQILYFRYFHNLN